MQSPLTKMFSHRSPNQVNVKEPVKEHLWDLHFAEFGRYCSQDLRLYDRSGGRELECGNSTTKAYLLNLPLFLQFSFSSLAKSE